MERLEPVLVEEAPDLVIVPGDVNSTLAAALTAVKMGIPVAHVESGLRSFDLTMPEEVNRIVADRFSELLFLHSDEAIENLRAEGIADERMHFVGNTMIDTLVALEDRFRGAGAAAAARGRARRLRCSSPCTARPWSTARCCGETVAAARRARRARCRSSSRSTRGPAR